MPPKSKILIISQKRNCSYGHSVLIFNCGTTRIKKKQIKKKTIICFQVQFFLHLLLYIIFLRMLFLLLLQFIRLASIQNSLAFASPAWGYRFIFNLRLSFNLLSHLSSLAFPVFIFLEKGIYVLCKEQHQKVGNTFALLCFTASSAFVVEKGQNLLRKKSFEGNICINLLRKSRIVF